MSDAIRLEDHIISALNSGRTDFSYLGTTWNLCKDRTHLLGVLWISIRQYAARMYYGRHSEGGIREAYQRLQVWTQQEDIICKLAEIDRQLTNTHCYGTQAFYGEPNIQYLLGNREALIKKLQSLPNGKELLISEGYIKREA